MKIGPGRPRKAQEGPGRPRNAQGGTRRPQETPGGPQETPGGLKVPDLRMGSPGLFYIPLRYGIVPGPETLYCIC